MRRDQAFPDSLREREFARVRARRDAAGVSHAARLVGVGLSGGGVRSATFALGFFQGLARRRLLRHIDYLSTVSGGGYFGAFLGRLHARACIKGVEDVEFVLGGDSDPETGPAGRVSGEEPPKDKTARGGRIPHPLDGYRADVLRYLRENGRYLSPNGSGDTLLGGAVLLRNLVSLHVALAFFVLLVLLASQLPYVLLAAADILRVPPLHVREPILVSPYAVPTACVLVLLVIPSGWAYWLVGHQRGISATEARLQALAPALLALLAALAIVLFGLQGRAPAHLLAWSLIGIGVLTLLAATVVDRRLPARLWTGCPAERDPATRETATLRQRVSRLHMLSIMLLAGLILITLVDSAGATLYWRIFAKDAPPLPGLLAGGATVLAVLAGAQQAITRIAPRSEQRPGLPRQMIAWLVATALLTLYLAVMATLAHGVGHGYALLVQESSADVGRIAARTLYATLVFAVVVLLLSRLHSFVNRSGHHALYMARLTRAFLGASNPRRHGDRDRSLLHVVADDDAALDDYHALRGAEASAAARAAPLHLINVTVNETVDGRSQLQRRDRKGIGLAFGPCGMSLGVRHHALTPCRPGESMVVHPAAEDDFQAFAYPAIAGSPPPAIEPLSLGALTAISGAAFSTGLGSRTSLPLSLLCGLANLRLGYWWQPGITPSLRGPRQPQLGVGRRLLSQAFPAYSFLLAELLARFRGTVLSHWYLSDGGHFENLAGYELIRRRLPMMLVVDAEADPDYTFHGLAGLIRKARIDFGATIHFLNAGELAALELDHVFGTLGHLRRRINPDATVTACGERSTSCLSQRHFALARVSYDDESAAKPEDRWLVYVKPTLTGAEPADLAEYLTRYPSFPHQPTSDQFFDESQWESYRMLGEHMATLLCREGASRTAEGGWSFLDRLQDGAARQH